MTHYETLKVSSSATVDEIRKAYRRAALKLHPDRNPGDKDAERQFKEISAAYTVLTDLRKRRDYDIKILRPSVPASPHPNGSNRTVFVFGRGNMPVHGGTSATNSMPIYRMFPGGVPMVVNGVPMPGFRSFRVHPMRTDSSGGTA